MKKGKLSKLDRLDKFDMLVALSKQRSFQVLIGVGFLYLLLFTIEIPFVFKNGFSSLTPEPLTRPEKLESEHELEERKAPNRPLRSLINQNSKPPTQTPYSQQSRILSTLQFDANSFEPGKKDRSVELHKSAKLAWKLGNNLWRELESGKIDRVVAKQENRSEKCPHSFSLSGSDVLARGKVMELPCGLTLGSHITVVGTPRMPHLETEQKISMVKEGGDSVMVSQFIVELQGLKIVEGEDPPRILHFNPRLMGDWSGKPVIEQNTCYRMQWGPAQRCEGWRSRDDEETVDGQVKCEKWIRDDDGSSEGSKATWWFSRLIGRSRKVNLNWPFHFVPGKLFVLTLSAGLEGYHVNVNGKHVTSFPYRTGFTLEDATGLTINGDVDVHSVFIASLPTTHPSYALQRHLEMSRQWQAPPLPRSPVEMFIGILSAGNHFAERMALRKSWMQHKLVRSSEVVARFFVALHARKEVNIELKKEAEFFGDIVIVPYMDNYDLVVLKTVAICEYGARTLSAKYLMKCDDDTFVRVDVVMDEAKKVPQDRSLYIGNMNYYHKPLRDGKWAVTYEEWPEEDYPPYANGPGYILSSDIASSIVNEFENHRLRLFKMEDVSMGMWVEQFSNSTKPVEYLHSLKYCQFGCIEDYYTAHYQSPRQMLCLWNKLQIQGRAQCCNVR